MSLTVQKPPVIFTGPQGTHNRPQYHASGSEGVEKEDLVYYEHQPLVPPVVVRCQVFSPSLAEC